MTVNVTVTAQDNGGTANGGVATSASQTFTITVTPVNDSPTANGQTLNTNEDTPLSIDVLANDTDVDNSLSSLAAALVTGPSHGTLTLNADGSLVYTPNANYNGPDTIIYQVCDNGVPQACSSSTVVVTVTSPLTTF